MELDPIKLYKLLAEKEISYLHHANTVTTALTFIKAGGLLSRGACERKRLYQTGQTSDRGDKLHHVWNDIFLDTLDLHKYFGRQNHYGPVLFRFSTEFLLKTKAAVWVTRDNPTRWRLVMKDKEKYFHSIKTLRDSWDTHKPERRMITLRDVDRPALFSHLEEIVIDDPGIQVGDINLHATARRAIRGAARQARLDVPINSRSDHRNCFCIENYSEKTTSEHIRNFFPLESFRQI